MKLIKLLDTHYIIVDDSEIKEGDFCVYNTGEIIQYLVKLNTDNLRKITHSTQPLYKNDFWAIKELKLSKVEEAINGYSVEKLAKDAYGEHDPTLIWAFCDGFNAHKELVKDKLFTVEDMEKAVIFGFEYQHKSLYNLDVKEFIQSLLPKTEWECTIDEQGKITIL